MDMQEILNYTRREYIRFLNSQDKYGAIEELAMLLAGDDCDDITTLVKALKEREDIMSTGIGFGIAIPHAKIHSVKKLTFALGISKEGIPFDSIDGKVVHLVILIAAGVSEHKEYLRLLSNIMSVLKNEPLKEKIIHSGSEKEILDILIEG